MSETDFPSPESSPRQEPPPVLLGAHIAIARIISLHTQPFASVDITITPATKSWTDLDDQVTEIEAMLGDDEARDDDDPGKLESSRMLEILTVLYELALDLSGLANKLQVQVLEHATKKGDEMVGGEMNDDGVKAMVERERERCQQLLRGVDEEFEHQGSAAPNHEL